jgi:hypothetical protein
MSERQLFLDSLSEEQRSTYLKLEKKQKSKNKKLLSYAEKNLDLFEKFFAGEAYLTDFTRDSRSKDVKSLLRYYFERKAKTNIKGDVTQEAKMCFQFKTFVSDLLMAKAILEGETDGEGNPIGHQQRFAVMRYELVKYLQSTSKKKVKEPKTKLPPAVSPTSSPKKQKKREAELVSKRQVDVSAIDDASKGRFQGEGDISPPITKFD